MMENILKKFRIFSKKSLKKNDFLIDIVCCIMKKFEQSGSVQDRPRRGRPSVINNKALQNVTNKFDRSPHKLLRRVYSAFWFSVMLSLMNKCYRIYIACILFINMRYTFGMLLSKHPVKTISTFLTKNFLDRLVTY